MKRPNRTRKRHNAPHGDGEQAPDRKPNARTKACDEWLESAEGKRCLDAAILRRFMHQPYLRNRLGLAFIAGANWCASEGAQ